MYSNNTPKQPHLILIAFQKFFLHFILSAWDVIIYLFILSTEDMNYEVGRIWRKWKIFAIHVFEMKITLEIIFLKIWEFWWLNVLNSMISQWKKKCKKQKWKVIFYKLNKYVVRLDVIIKIFWGWIAFKTINKFNVR